MRSAFSSSTGGAKNLAGARSRKVATRMGGHKLTGSALLAIALTLLLCAIPGESKVRLSTETVQRECLPGGDIDTFPFWPPSVTRLNSVH